jgi:catechol 2,3-dioxygenase-like lactoylglutathione lyase family enzyme
MEQVQARTPVLNTIGIVCSDMARSLTFYRLLGLSVPETPDDGHINIDLPNGFRLMLDSEAVIRSFRPDWTRQTGNQVALALDCQTPAEVDQLYERMATVGFQVDTAPWNAFWGQRYAQLRDPDGVPIDLYATL